MCSMGFALNIFSYFLKDSLIFLLQRGAVLAKSTDIAFNLPVGTSLRYQRFLRKLRQIQRGMVDHQIALQVKKLFYWHTKLLVSSFVVHGYVFEISFWQLLCRVCELILYPLIDLDNSGIDWFKVHVVLNQVLTVVVYQCKSIRNNLIHDVTNIKI